jgi:hypothetical protein
MCSRQKSTISFVSLLKIDIGRCIARWFQSAEGKGDAERLGLNLFDGMCTFLFFQTISFPKIFEHGRLLAVSNDEHVYMK